MKFKHLVEPQDKFQIAYTNINLELTPDDLIKHIRHLKREHLITLQKALTRMIVDPGTEDAVTIQGHGEIEINMDYLVDRMEFDAYLFAHHQGMNHVILTRPSYLAAELEFLEGLYALRDKIKQEHFEDILDGNI